jgi:hypothetical protein
MTNLTLDDEHALLRAVVRLETKVDQMLEAQRLLRADLHGIEERLRQVETKVVRLEQESRQRRAWPNMLSALAAAAALVVAIYK